MGIPIKMATFVEEKYGKTWENYYEPLEFGA
jgi:hypothetical protein